MSKRRKRNIDTVNALDRIDKNLETIAKNTEETNNKLGSFINGNKSKLTRIMSIITIFAALATISGFTLRDFLKKNVTDPQPQYEIYLGSDYSKVEVNAHTNLLATLNFNTEAVSLTASNLPYFRLE